MLLPGLCTNAPNGQAVSRTTYSALFAEIGTTFGEGDGSTHEYGVNFDASRSSSIYGASDTVTPKNISVNWFIKY